MIAAVLRIDAQAKGAQIIEIELKAAGRTKGGAPPNAIRIPGIAGLPQFAKDDDAVKFFETGLLPDGSRARPPMRQFRFKHSDAVALVAYLRSVPKQ